MPNIEELVACPRELVVQENTVVNGTAQEVGAGSPVSVGIP